MNSGIFTDPALNSQSKNLDPKSVGKMAVEASQAAVSSDQLLGTEESSEAEEPSSDRTDVVPYSCSRMSWEADRSW